MHERLFSVVVGAIMLFSVVGYAYSGLSITGGATHQQQEQYTLPTVLDRFLTGQEKSTILRQGRVVIEAVYSEDCERCASADAELKEFARSYPGFLILQSVTTTTGDGWDTLQMTGPSGQITTLDDTLISQDYLFELFCATAVITPRECLLKNFAEGVSSS